MDINGLKNFNREFGHEYGDEVVIRVGEVLEEHFRSSLVFRMTGDEYLVAVEDATYDTFIKKRERCTSINWTISVLDWYLSVMPGRKWILMQKS